MITSSNFNISLQVGPREGGGTENKKKTPTIARPKHAQVAAPDFWTPRGDLGQLELPKLIEKWTAKAPQSQSKNDTTDNDKTQTGNKSAVGQTEKIDTRH